MPTTIGHASEWTAAPLHPVAHWEHRTTPEGRGRLEMVWEVPEPVAPTALTGAQPG